MFDSELIDYNLYEIITNCILHKVSPGSTEIIVTYENGEEERIWTYDPKRYSFNYREFVGMTKIEAVFYCDRKAPRKMY